MGRVVARCIKALSFASNRNLGKVNGGFYLAPCARRVAEVRKMRIFLADDHRYVLELTRTLLEPTFDVVGAVEDGEALVETAGNLQPDIIITDISMPKLNGIEAADRLRESGSSSKIVFLTVHADPDFVQAALKTGALAYVSKSRISTDLLLAVGEALNGCTFVSPM